MNDDSIYEVEIRARVRAGSLPDAVRRVRGVFPIRWWPPGTVLCTRARQLGPARKRWQQIGSD